MKAMCTVCFGDGCARCDDSGEIEVNIIDHEDEDVYTIYCSDCHESNGCRFVNQKHPLPSKPDINCVFCNSKRVAYTKLPLPGSHDAEQKD